MSVGASVSTLPVPRGLGLRFSLAEPTGFRCEKPRMRASSSAPIPNGPCRTVRVKIERKPSSASEGSP